MLSGARSLAVGMVASVTAAGGNVSVVGLPDFGLLAAGGDGCRPERLAVIPNPGTDPVEAAAVLADGMDLVVLGLAGWSVTATRARAVGTGPSARLHPVGDPRGLAGGVVTDGRAGLRL